MTAAANTPCLSILVPAYGVAGMIGDALRSLQAQNRDDWEAIVVDDGTPDDIEGALRPFADDPRIRLLRTDNRGVSAARNHAAAAARAPVLACLDGDDAYEPHYVEAVLAAFEDQPDAAFITCDATFFGAADRAGRRFSSYHPQAGPVTLERVLSREFNVFTGSAIRRSAFIAVHGYDETLRTAEDFDLWLRLLAAGHRAIYIERPLCRYRRRPGSLSSNAAAMAADERRVYARMAVTLAGRPEELVIHRMLAALASEESWRQGEDLILAGATRQGLALLRGAEQRSLRWQVAIPLMRLFPVLARPLLKIRVALPEPSRP